MTYQEARRLSDESMRGLLNGLVKIAEKGQHPGFVLEDEDFPNQTKAEKEANDRWWATRRKEAGLKPGQTFLHE